MPTLLPILDLAGAVSALVLLALLVLPLPVLALDRLPGRVRARREARRRGVVARALRAERGLERYWAERADCPVAPPPRPEGGVYGDGRPLDRCAVAARAIAADEARGRRRAARAG
jgi:hypothetical protein